MQHVENIEIIEVTDATRSLRVDPVVREAEVVIRLDNRIRQRLFCLPADLEELALGHLALLGIAASDIAVKWTPKRISVSASTAGTVKPGEDRSAQTVSQSQVFKFVEMLDDNCPIYRKTGGTHVVGMVCGRDSVFVEDVSRHCAIDKALGAALKRGMRPPESVLVTSCRQTLSTMNKAVDACIPIVITVSAATDQAIRCAQEADTTLVGFARERRFNVYCHDWRIVRDCS